MTLYLKYRPTLFDDIFGNEHIIEPLRGLLAEEENRPHVFLLHGPKGCGKTTIARIIAKELECSEIDLKEIDTADFRGIDTAREIRRMASYKPMNGPCRVWILDECHQLTTPAQSALLKVLEEAPSHIYYILCTTNLQGILLTVRDRCSQFQVKPLNEKQMFRLLRMVVKAEDTSLKKPVYEQIIQDSLGHPRAALQILDQVLQVEPDKQLKMAEQSAEMQSQSIELCRALISASGWKKITNILRGLKDQEPESIRRHVLGYCESVLLKGSENNQAGLVMEEFIEPFYNSGWPGLVFACYSIVKGA